MFDISYGVKAKGGWLNSVYVVNFFFVFIGKLDLVNFFQAPDLAAHWLEDFLN